MDKWLYLSIAIFKPTKTFMNKIKNENIVIRQMNLMHLNVKLTYLPSYCYSLEHTSIPWAHFTWRYAVKWYWFAWHTLLHLYEPDATTNDTNHIIIIIKCKNTNMKGKKIISFAVVHNIYKIF